MVGSTSSTIGEHGFEVSVMRWEVWDQVFHSPTESHALLMKSDRRWDSSVFECFGNAENMGATPALQCRFSEL